jgi:hypothetical protein
MGSRKKIQTYNLSELLASVRLTATLKKFIKTATTGSCLIDFPKLDWSG